MNGGAERPVVERHGTPAAVPSPLRLLIVEDSTDDAELILSELRSGGLTLDAHRVDSAEQLASLLAAGRWDLVISDYHLPRFSAPEALRIVREHGADLPVIVVSGSIGEEAAAATMKAGASDYVMKDALARLAHAVRREVADAGRRRRHAQAEEALREAQEQLRQAQKMQAVGRLAGGVAHDFNNLLTAVLGYSELLLQQMPDDVPERADVQEIHKAGHRAAALTRQLLALSRQQMLEPRVLNFNTIVADFETLLRRVIGSDVHVRLDLDPAIGRVKVDPGQMEQVLINLAMNARDAMPAGGRLLIRTSQRTLDGRPLAGSGVVVPGPYVNVTVEDTGTGMTPDVLERIFEPFFTTKEVGRGTGLGLASVYGIVKQSGGHILVDSRPGQGTTFELYLPCVEAPLDPAEPDGWAPQTVSGWETVLLVDDDPDVLHPLRRALAEAGYRVLTASDGVNALDVARTHAGPIHMLIADVVMPHLRGDRLAHELASIDGTLIVLFMSGHTSQPWTPATPAYHHAHLQKPFTPSTLVRKVRELLDGAARSRDGLDGGRARIDQRDRQDASPAPAAPVAD